MLKVLKLARVSAEKSQATLAEELGLTRPTYIRIEKYGELQRLRGDVVLKIHEVLGLTPNQLFGIEE